MRCILCKTENSSPIEIFSCSVCKCNYGSFTEPANYDDYGKLYEGMGAYCENLKIVPNPWRQAANRGFPYEKIIEFFMNQDQQLDVLDVGCGWGYVDYVLRGLNFKVRGIDISKEAIDFATKTYGEFYELKTVQEYEGKHDLILAVEVFEHLADPKGWLKRCLEIAPRVMITTPNLSVYKTPWVSEMPPIHMAIYRKKSLEWLAKDLGVKVEVDDSSLNLIAMFSYL